MSLVEELSTPHVHVKEFIVPMSYVVENPFPTSHAEFLLLELLISMSHAELPTPNAACM